MTEPAWSSLAEGIWCWGLVPLRAQSVESRPNPAKPGSFLVTRKCAELDGAERVDFESACEAIHAHAKAANVDEGALILDIARALEAGAHKAGAKSATRVGRLSPEQRRQYRQRAAAARSLAQWLAAEITERPIPVSNGDLQYVFTEGDDRNPSALADVLIQRKFVKVDASPTGVVVYCEGGPRSVAGAMHRVADTINGLHWLADLLRADAERSRPQGAPAAPWKGTATLLRRLFEDRLGAPLLPAVAALAGLAHRCEIPVAEVSRLSKP